MEQTTMMFAVIYLGIMCLALLGLNIFQHHLIIRSQAGWKRAMRGWLRAIKYAEDLKAHLREDDSNEADWWKKE